MSHLHLRLTREQHRNLKAMATRNRRQPGRVVEGLMQAFLSEGKVRQMLLGRSGDASVPNGDGFSTTLKVDPGVLKAFKRRADRLKEGHTGLIRWLIEASVTEIGEILDFYVKNGVIRPILDENASEDDDPVASAAVEVEAGARIQAMEPEMGYLRGLLRSWPRSSDT